MAEEIYGSVLVLALQRTAWHREREMMRDGVQVTEEECEESLCRRW